MVKQTFHLPLRIADVDRSNLLSAFEPVRGCLKTTSMLWMHAMRLPVLSGVVIDSWSELSVAAVRQFCRHNDFTQLLLRIDRRDQRWTRRRGGYLVGFDELPKLVRELKRERMLTILLEPKSPFNDQYSFAGVTVPESAKIIIEIVGSGFDASDILRGDLPPHERWESALNDSRSSSAGRTMLIGGEEYRASVQRRLAKIGARIVNPAYPDDVLKSVSSQELIERGIASLKSSRQTTLLKHAENYVPVPEKLVRVFVSEVEKALKGLSQYGIHLGPSSFAASMIPKRGLIFWDFFPARKQEAASLYPSS